MLGRADDEGVPSCGSRRDGGIDVSRGDVMVDIVLLQLFIMSDRG